MADNEELRRESHFWPITPEKLFDIVTMQGISTNELARLLFPDDPEPRTAGYYETYEDAGDVVDLDVLARNWDDVRPSLVGVYVRQMSFEAFQEMQREILACKLNTGFPLLGLTSQYVLAIYWSRDSFISFLRRAEELGLLVYLHLIGEGWSPWFVVIDAKGLRCFKAVSEERR